MKNSLISIIVPFFDSENYLTRCLESILNMTYSNFEVILIDDGSTDSSLAICEKFSLLDARLKIYRQNNRGVSAARNLGIAKSKGDWICFVDSDDEVLPNYLSNMLAYANEDVDLIFSGFLKKDEQGNYISELIFEKQSTLQGNEIAKIFNELHLFKYGFPFSKLFRKSLITGNNIEFKPQVKTYEDGLFLLDFIVKCRVITISNSQQYIYYQREGSLSSKLHKFSEEIAVSKYLIEFVKQNFGISIYVLSQNYSEFSGLISAFVERSIKSTLIYSNSTSVAINDLNKISEEMWYLYSKNVVTYNRGQALLKYLLLSKRFIAAYYIDLWYKRSKFIKYLLFK